MANDCCPVCHGFANSYSYDVFKDEATVVCPTCGKFTITFKAEEMMDLDKLASYLYYHAIFDESKNSFHSYYYIYYDEKKESEYWTISNDIVENWYPKTMDEKIDCILKFLGDVSKVVGKQIHFSGDQAMSLFFVKRYNSTTRSMLSEEDINTQYNFIIDIFNKNELIDIFFMPEESDLYLTLTHKGWQRLDELKKAQQSDMLSSAPFDHLTDNELKKLIEKAKELYSKGEKSLAVEKLWDAFERLKTHYYTNKSKSVPLICKEMSGGSQDYSDLFSEEFRKLTDIGNEYRIRHHETNKININDERYYDYLYLRCFSLISTAVKFI